MSSSSREFWDLAKFAITQTEALLTFVAGYLFRSIADKKSEIENRVDDALNDLPNLTKLVMTYWQAGPTREPSWFALEGEITGQLHILNSRLTDLQDFFDPASASTIDNLMIHLRQCATSDPFQNGLDRTPEPQRVQTWFAHIAGLERTLRRAERRHRSKIAFVGRRRF